MLRSRHMGQSWMVIVCESGSTTIKMRKRERISSFSGFCLSEYSTLNLYSHLSILLKFRLKTLPTNGEQQSWNTKCNLWVQSHFSHARLFVTPWLQPTRLLCPWDSPGKNSGVGCHALLQGIFSTQGSNPHVLLSPPLAGWFFTTSTTWEAQKEIWVLVISLTCPALQVLQSVLLQLYKRIQALIT